MTFYYDELRDTHQANTYPVEPYLYGIPSKEKEQTTHVVFSPSFADARPTSTKSWFYRFENLRHIDGMENLNTTKVTDMSSMFSYCSSLKSIDVSRFDTSKVENMDFMFHSCSSLAELDLSNFTISPGCETYSMLGSCLHALPSVRKINKKSAQYGSTGRAPCRSAPRQSPRRPPTACGWNMKATASCTSPTVSRWGTRMPARSTSPTERTRTRSTSTTKTAT